MVTDKNNEQEKYRSEIASGDHKEHPNHGKVVSTGFGGSRWYQYSDGTVKTYLQLLQENNKK